MLVELVLAMNRLLLISFLLIAGLSCKKLVSLVFPGKDVAMPAIKVDVPAIPVADSTKTFEAGNLTTYINVDSIIKANTNGAFGIGSVSSVKVKQVTVNVSNADADNNLSAFKSFRITVSSNSNSQVSDMVTVDIPAWATDSYTSTPASSADITSYLGGSYIYNTIYGQVRKTTTKTLTVSIAILLRAN